MSRQDISVCGARRALRPLALALLLGAGFHGLAGLHLIEPALAQSAAPLAAPPASPRASFAPLVARVKPAVVQISTRSRPAAASSPRPSMSARRPLP